MPAAGNQYHFRPDVAKVYTLRPIWVCIPTPAGNRVADKASVATELNLGLCIICRHAGCSFGYYDESDANSPGKSGPRLPGGL